jgi:hypothetical protein
MLSDTSTVESVGKLPAADRLTRSLNSDVLSFNPEQDHASGKQLQDALLTADIKSLFSRASNLMREAMQLDGSAFFDASYGAFGAGTFGDSMKPRAPGAYALFNFTDTTSSGSDGQGSSVREGHSQPSVDNPATLIGFSTRTRSSLQSHVDSERLGPFSEELLRILAKKYPHGKIFSFDEDGSISSSDRENSSEASPKVGSLVTSDVNDRPSVSQSTPALKTRKVKRMLSRQAEAAAILKVIPSARSVAWFPLWDATSERWFAGTLVWSSDPLRQLTPEDELLYMVMALSTSLLALLKKLQAAWSNSIMAEVARLSALVASRMKVDFVSSISHELRSPLHGILASVEFLQEEENMPPMQADMINTIV